ncbi:MAG: sugar transferase [Akkermansiaceae bacterium]
MLRLRHKLLIRIHRLLDQAILCFCLAGVVYIKPDRIKEGGLFEPGVLQQTNVNLENVVGVLLLMFGWFIIYSDVVRYKQQRFTRFKHQLGHQLRATTISSFLLLIISVLFSFGNLTILHILVFWVCANILGIISRIIIRSIFSTARKSGFNLRYLLMIGINEKSIKFAQDMEEQKQLGYKIVGFVAEDDLAAQKWSDDRWSLIGKLDGLQEILKREKVDEIMICVSFEPSFNRVMDVIRLANDLGLVARILPSTGEGLFFKKLRTESFEGQNMLTLLREQLLIPTLLKRMIDIAISLGALVMTAPLFVIVAIWIKRTDGGPIFYLQDRVGLNQRRFKIYKFRSMVMDADKQVEKLKHLNEQDGPAFKIKDDPRVTKVGRFIRKTSIDELPQLLNVLSGEMSLVGPRPPLPKEVEGYEWKYRKRLSIKPGITCIWQISGRNTVSFEKWMQLDSEYVEKASILLDLKILFLTIPAVLLRRGAS